MQIKVLHVIGSLSGGGAEHQLKLLLNGLDIKSFRVGVAFFNDDTTWLNREGICCYHIKRRNKVDVVSVCREIESVFDEFSPDLVQLWFPEVITIPAAVVARRKGCRVVSTQRHRLGGAVSFPNKIRDLLGVLGHLLSHKIVTNYDIATEPFWFRALFRERAGCVIRNAVIKPRTQRALFYDNKPAEFRVLYVGRLVKQKRVEVLLDAVAKILESNNEVSVKIYGKGTLKYESILRKKCAALGIEKSVTFEGYLKNWIESIDEFDVLVLPSVTEGMPNVVVEAMSAGLPVVASDIFEIRSFVRHGIDAELFTPNDSGALVDALLKLHGSRDMLHSYQSAGRELAHCYSLSRMVDLYQAIYRNVVKQRGYDE